MDFSVVLELVMAGGASVIMFFLKKTITQNEQAIEVLKHDLQEVKLTYMNKEDFRDFKDELKQQFLEVKQAIRDIKT